MANKTTRFSVVKAEGVYLYLSEHKKVIDGVSSWWAAIHGYNHPALNQALQEQAANFSHVMLGGLEHQPAQELATKLVEITPSGLNHVFFSDSGSVGVEVALKMAIQFWRNQGNLAKTNFLSLRHAYHGDTFKAMEVGDDSDFQQAFGHVLQKGYFLETPAGGFHAAAAALQPDIDKLENLLQTNHHTIAAFILEPLVQCAGGFRMYSPLYLQAAKELCTKYNVLLIFDEVATGFGRTGKRFAADHAGVTPDIMILGKALTAGYLGHAATLTTTRVFEGFLGADYDKAFMHGPTFMGNALACAVALKSIELFEQEDYPEKVSRIEATLQEHLGTIRHGSIREVRVLGAIGVVEVTDAKYLEGFTDYAVQHGAWLRPFGNYVYLMPPYIIQEEELKQLILVISNWFTKFN